MGDRVGIGLDLRAEAPRLQHLDDALAGDEAIQAIQRQRLFEVRAFEEMGEEGRILLQQKPRLRIEDVDGLHTLVEMATSHLEVVEVMGGGDLDRAGALFGIGIVVADDGDAAPHQRQDHMATDEVPELLVFRMHRHRRIAQHGLGPGGGDSDEGIRIFRIINNAFKRIVEVPEMALHLHLLHLQIGDGGQQLGVPVDQALVLVDQPLAMQLHEDLEDGLGQALVHGEAFAAPVAGGAEALQLVDDGSAALGLPGPDALEEGLAAHLPAARLLALHELTLDDHLGRNARMVRARLPEHILAAHALEPAQDVLQRVVEGVAHVQGARHIGRGDHDAVGRGPRPVRATGAEGLRLIPGLSDAAFDGGGIETLVHHGAKPGFKGRVSLRGVEP